MSPEERTRRAVGLFQQMLNTLPPASAMLASTPEEIAAREQEGQALAAELRELVRGEGDGERS